MDEVFLKQVQDVLNRIQDATPSDVISVKGGEDGVFQCTVPSTMLPTGASAGELRDAGCSLREEIPDCAVMKNGMFEWLDVELTVEDKQ